ncbi:hypothetical protein [Vibrio sp. WXL103]|uniref:hypothetical protein n=1 Tax=Vibrio sp. WXL103 TaxID=3450710 RepID=UPI003EC93F77
MLYRKSKTNSEWVVVVVDIFTSVGRRLISEQQRSLDEPLFSAQRGEPTVHVKAAYEPINQTEIIRPSEVTRVEKGPIEKQIVIEIAGQWKGNAAYLSLAKTDEQTERIAKPAADPKSSHRSLFTFRGLDDESRSLYLKIPCVGDPTPISLKLAENVTTVDKGSEKDEWDTVLVPVFPLYQSGGTFKAYDKGYIYVIWNGRLWREIEIQPNGYFSDLDIGHQHKPVATTKHVNINGSILFPSSYLGEERIQIIQNDKTVFEGQLDVQGSLRVFNLIEDQVEVNFVDFDHEPIVLPTHVSPLKLQLSKNSQIRGMPMPHIWLPYKIMGEVQSDCYIYHASKALSDDQVAELEANCANMAIPLEELNSYSSSQSFEGELIKPLPELEPKAFAEALVAGQLDKNVAAIVLNPPTNIIKIRYKHCPKTDQSDDYFMIRNEEADWEQKAFFRNVESDGQGNFLFSFCGWPTEISTVDIYRISHCGCANENADTYIINKDVSIADLIYT